MKRRKRKKKKRKKSVTPKFEIEEWKTKQTGTVFQKNVKECPTSAATVYSDRAEVTRNVSGVVKESGVHTIEIDGFLSGIDDESFRVSSPSDGIAIMEVSSEDVFIKEEFQISKMKEMKEAKQELKHKKQMINIDLKIIQTENDWIRNYVNTSLDKQRMNEKNEIRNVEPEEVTSVLEFSRKKYIENDEKKIILDKQLIEINKEINKLRDEYNFIYKPKTNTKYKKKVIIQFAAREANEFLLQLSYIVQGATWKPIYSVRVDTVNKNCVLAYQADIVNNTDEDWENVLVTLSSSKPQHEGQPPTLPALEVVSREEVKERRVETTNKKRKTMNIFSKGKVSQSNTEQIYLSDTKEGISDDESSDISEKIAEVMGAEVQKSVSNSVFSNFKTY